jgi:hypothetical protein
VKFDFEAVSRPRELYPLFVGYQPDAATEV